MGTYQIEEKAINNPERVAYNMHVWVQGNNDAGRLIISLQQLDFIMHMQVITPMEPRIGKYPLAVFVQLPSAIYAASIRGRALTILGANREIEIQH